MLDKLTLSDRQYDRLLQVPKWLPRTDPSQLTGHSVSKLVALETKVLWKTHDVRVPLPSIASASSP